MTAVYNENDPKAAAWLRHLIEEGVIAHGIVDERSICDVEARDYRGFAQVHLFAGIGIWSSALRLAGWPDDRRVGTCSCPCQPFSAAGKGLGFADPRHLWPHAFRLIGELRLDIVFGEQAPTAVDWIDLVSFDLEGIGYAVGAPVVPAAGFAAAHIRGRFYWVADANNAQWWSDRAPGHERDWPTAGRLESYREPGAGGSVGRAADLAGQRRDEERPVAPGRADGGHAQGGGTGSWSGRGSRGMAEAHGEHAGAWRQQRSGQQRQFTPDGRPCDWLPCADGAYRPVESGTFPLAHEDPERLGRLRGYGNALDRKTAAAFVAAYLDVAPARVAIA